MHYFPVWWYNAYFHTYPLYSFDNGFIVAGALLQPTSPIDRICIKDPLHNPICPLLTGWGLMHLPCAKGLPSYIQSFGQLKARHDKLLRGATSLPPCKNISDHRNTFWLTLEKLADDFVSLQRGARQEACALSVFLELFCRESCTLPFETWLRAVRPNQTVNVLWS